MINRLYLRGIALAAVAIIAYPHSGAQVSSQTQQVQLGAQIVATGNARGTVACARCHGFDGAADGSGAFPVLAGQSPSYLKAQLRSYASGHRENAIMGNIAKRLTAEEIDAVAQYYSSRHPDLFVQRTHDKHVLQRGEEIALGGELTPRVQACVSCHGPQGVGLPPSVPYLAGQYQHYIESQLAAYRRGSRTSAQMGSIGHNLSKDDAAAVAAYFEQQPLPASTPESTHAATRGTVTNRK